MPVTKGAGNADWTWDETVLALDLYYRRGGPVERSDAEVIGLSAYLRGADFVPTEGRKPNFRNPDGVALKLQNLRSALEPGHGLSSSKRDKAVVAAYPPSTKAEVAKVAAAIRATLAIGIEAIEEIPDEEVFVEGRTVTVAHRLRDRRLRSKLLERKADAELTCEVCSYSPPPLSRVLRESFFEAHHVRPLAETLGERTTRVSDMALLCAGCHRFVHRLIATERRWVSIGDAREYLLA